MRRTRRLHGSCATGRFVQGHANPWRLLRELLAVRLPLGWKAASSECFLPKARMPRDNQASWHCWAGWPSCRYRFSSCGRQCACRPSAERCRLRNLASPFCPCPRHARGRGCDKWHGSPLRTGAKRRRATDCHHWQMRVSPGRARTFPLLGPFDITCPHILAERRVRRQRSIAGGNGRQHQSSVNGCIRMSRTGGQGPLPPIAVEGSAAGMRGSSIDHVEDQIPNLKRMNS